LFLDVTSPVHGAWPYGFGGQWQKQKVLIEVSGLVGVKSAGEGGSTRYIQGCQGRLSMFIIAAWLCSRTGSKPVEYGT
jgi:hypothetical protein